MDNELLRILNEELIELKKQTYELKENNKLVEKRLDLQREELNLHRDELKRNAQVQQEQLALLDRHSKKFDRQDEMLQRHQAGFEILFRNMKDMEERMTIELKRLRDGQ